METDSIARLDSFPYAHRVAEVMKAPVQTALVAESALTAARRLAEARISALVVVDEDQFPAGIVTERDLLRVLSAGAGEKTGPEKTLGEIMSKPVVSVAAEDFVYVAIGRMARLNLRHLVVVDSAGRLSGIVTSRDLLKLRSGDTLQLGDRLETATRPEDMDAVRRALPQVSRLMLNEGLGAGQVAEVISAIYRAISARAAELIATQMTEDPAWGPAPHPWCFLVLGSGGRGESLLAPDQDNAMVHRGTSADDPWYAEAGKRIADLLDAAGIPYCKGQVMASNPKWRKSLADWHGEINGWMASSKPDDFLSVDIFFDFRCVYGDAALAEQLAEDSAALAAQSTGLLKMLGLVIEELAAPLGVLGRIKTRDGRVDLKKGGLLPLVSTARVLGLKAGLTLRGTRARLKGAAEAGHKVSDLERLLAAHETILAAILGQQLHDLEQGLEPGSKVEVKHLSRLQRKTLKEALGLIDGLKLVVRDALSMTQIR